MSLFEMGMLVCFGMSWPANISKSLRTKNSTGKSLTFLLIVEIGYICGILHKIIYCYDWVIWLYALNFLMVSFDIFLFGLYKKHPGGLKTEKNAEAAAANIR